MADFSQENDNKSRLEMARNRFSYTQPEVGIGAPVSSPSNDRTSDLRRGQNSRANDMVNQVAQKGAKTAGRIAGTYAGGPIGSMVAGRAAEEVAKVALKNKYARIALILTPFIGFFLFIFLLILLFGGFYIICQQSIICRTALLWIP